MASPRWRSWRTGLVALAAAAGIGVFGTTTSGAAPAVPTEVGGPAVVQVLSTSTYGTVLVTTFGPYADVPLFELSSDANHSFACTHKLVDTYEGLITCTGPEHDFFQQTSDDEWPAFTTSGQPVAGAGVRASLLGTVERPGIGDQVTYAGHPLYLFTPPSNPFVPTGEGFFESVLPLPDWHGLWDLVSAATGHPATGPAVIGTGTLPDGSRVVTSEEYPYAVPGGVAITAYDFGPGTPSGPGCTFGCTTEWIPVLTQGAPRAESGVAQSSLGVVSTAEGQQVTYDGRPLWLYAFEAPVFTPKGPQTTGTVGNGVGVAGPGGIAEVIPA